MKRTTLRFFFLILLLSQTVQAAKLNCKRVKEWIGGSQLDCAVSPTTETAQSLSWTAQVTFNGNVIEAWQVQKVSLSGKTIVVKNMFYNSDVLKNPGFSVIVNRPDGGLSSYQLSIVSTNGQSIVTTDLANQISVLYDIQSWGNGGQIRARVGAARRVQLRSMEMDVNRCVALRDVWGASKVEIFGGKLRVEFLPENNWLLPTHQIQFGFNYNGECSEPNLLLNPKIKLYAPEITYSTTNYHSSLGTNLTGPTDWTTEYPFVDAFKKSRPWISGTAGVWEDSRALDLDSNGFVKSLQPNQIARTLLFSQTPTPVAPSFLSGDITILYDGEGKIEYGVSSDSITRSPGKDVIRFNPSKGGYFIINVTETNPNNYLRNFRAILPGGRCQNDGMKFCTADSECGGNSCVSFLDSYDRDFFHPTFLKETKPYRAIRFMDMQFTNGSKQSKWSDRPKKQDSTWVNRGVPVEVLANLCNLLKVDGWFNIPHLADDDYVLNFAKTLKANLAPERKAYVEYSNEIWNNIFEQTKYATARGKALGLSQNDFDAAILYNAKRAMEVHRLFSQVLSSSQLVRVMGSFSGWSYTTERLMKVPGLAENIDALAIGPYFGGALGQESVVTQKKLKTMSVADFATLIRNEELPKVFNEIRVARQLIDAKRPGIDLVAYEGGQHLTAQGVNLNDPALNTLFSEMNHSPLMEAVYSEYLRGWKNNGGDLFMHFVNASAPSIWGDWGALDYTGEGTSPKYRAIVDFLTLYPKWW